VARRQRIPLVAAASFLAGFAVAELTGDRALGGLVLLAGGAWCAYSARSIAGWRPTAVIIGGALGLFVVSHLLGHVIGAWPAVAVSAAAVAVLSARVLATYVPREG
jgi:hypothetical protein